MLHLANDVVIQVWYLTDIIIIEVAVRLAGILDVDLFFLELTDLCSFVLIERIQVGWILIFMVGKEPINVALDVIAAFLFAYLLIRSDLQLILNVLILVCVPWQLLNLIIL